MPAGFSIPKSGFKGIEALGQLGEQAVHRLGEVLGSQRPTLNLAQLARQLANSMGGADTTVLEIAIRDLLIPLNQLRCASEMAPADFLRQFGKAVERDAPKDWDQSRREQWQRIADHLQPLLERDNLFSILAKATDLFFNRSATLLDLRILTDERPVFNENADEARAVILTNTLVVEYVQGGQRQVAHLTMDLNDLRNLAAELERCRKKNTVLLKDASGRGIDVLTIGESEKPNGV